MNIKRFMKIALVVLIAIMVFCSIAYAENDNFDMKAIEEKANSADNDTVKTPVMDAFSMILSVLRIVATGIAFVVIAVVAMKYMMAAPGDRADIKKSSIQFVVGAFVVFGAANLLPMLLKAFEDMAPDIK